MKQDNAFGWKNYLENNSDLKELCDLILSYNKHSKHFVSEIEKFKNKIDFRDERDQKFKELFENIKQTNFSTLLVKTSSIHTFI
jgi:hypothetical protein